MCLDTISKNLKRDTASLKVDSRGYIELEKDFCVTRCGNLVAPCFGRTCFYEGKNTAPFGWVSNIFNTHRYKVGFHCYAKKGGVFGTHTQTVKTRKEWIVAAGTQHGRKVVVCKHIII